MPPRLTLLPDSDGYSSAEGDEVIAIKLAGGASRLRRDKLGAAKTVNVKWTMNPSDYQYWRAFFRTATLMGSLPFECQLVSEDGCGPAWHICTFVPGSVSLPSQQGWTYVQQATLEVTPLPTDASQDEMIMDIYEELGPNANSVLLALAHLVNVTAPAAIG
jgi:hypothetical protein